MLLVLKKNSQMEYGMGFIQHKTMNDIHNFLRVPIHYMSDLFHKICYAFVSALP